MAMPGPDKLKMNELMILRQEEIAIKKAIEMYQNTLNRLQVEELNIRSMLGHIQDVELKSRTTTPLEASVVQGENVKEVMEKYSNIRPGIAMDEFQVNQRTLDLDSTPLIQRMLRDSQVYEEEEEEDREEDVLGNH
ncbi:snRNA-activating protein complex subunit 5-like isoform X1 [Macrobrachium rosenbergii]|uniref:snRNA-activating protein complex subunit 5-like isoform X1 n=2 Tax=Macrobrachium rosenbergii TaxID=79674 RepID=UPI0034D6F8A6